MKYSDDLIVRAAELYYQQNLNQNAIAEILGTSRPTVSRLLDEARDAGIVQIIINSPIKKNAELSKRLRTELNLKDAIIVSGTYSYSEALQKCSKAASSFLHSILENNMQLGITWGSSMDYFADALEPREYYNVNVVQMVGCLGTGNPRIDGLELAIKISRKLGGTYSNIYAPAYVGNEEVHKYLVSEPQIESTLKKALSTDIVISGIGSLSDDASTPLISGYISEKERQYLLSKGCVGHMLARMYDINGNELNLDDKFVISAPLSSLKTPNWSIGICAHPQKALACYAAIKCKYINCLIADESLAQAILDYNEQQS